MGATCSRNKENEKCSQSFGRNTSMDKTAWETDINIRTILRASLRQCGLDQYTSE
jgi:hypothetical protein